MSETKRLIAVAREEAESTFFHPTAPDGSVSMYSLLHDLANALEEATRD